MLQWIVILRYTNLFVIIIIIINKVLFEMCLVESWKRKSRQTKERQQGCRQWDRLV